MASNTFTLAVDNSDEVLVLKNQAVLKALTKIALKAEGYAKKSLTESGAVDTGNLRNSVTGETDGQTVQVGTNVNYAFYVEEGTYDKGDPKGMKPRPYIKPSIADHIDEYQEILKKFLEDA